MAKTYSHRQEDGKWYVVKNDELYIECGGETVAWLIAQSLNHDDNGGVLEVEDKVTDLIVSLSRYSEKTLTELTDPDFARAVQRVIELLKRRTGNG